MNMMPPVEGSAHLYAGSFTGVPRRGERVEKVSIEPLATTNRARNGPKLVCSVADPGRKRVPREFFNTLGNSTNFAFTEFLEVRLQHPALTACEDREDGR
jgi:hypothetical protein